MQSQVLKFNTRDKTEFYKTLRKRVNSYFNEKNITKYANHKMVIKTVFMLLLYFIPLILMLVGVADTTLSIILMWVLMGFGMSGIGLSVMHDANHGAYSKNSKTNKYLGALINLVGGYDVNWKIQHNVLHHSYTNIDGYDEDISKASVFRMSPFQEHKKYYKYQAFYAPFLYSIMSLYWLISKDFEQLARYKKRGGLLEAQGTTYKKAIWQVVWVKFIYALVTIILPLLFIEVPWWQILIGFLIMHFICGIMLALIFQSAHVIEETHFFKPPTDGNIENHWALHQMQTTANFARNSRIFSWFIGGLNYQIEHHLFPNICHIHYQALSKIVQSTAEEFGVPYYEHKTFFGAVASHFSFLNKLGMQTANSI